MIAPAEHTDVVTVAFQVAGNQLGESGVVFDQEDVGHDVSRNTVMCRSQIPCGSRLACYGGASDTESLTDSPRSGASPLPHLILIVSKVVQGYTPPVPCGLHLTFLHRRPTQLHSTTAQVALGCASQYWDKSMSKNLFAPFCLLALTLALSACDKSADEAPATPPVKVRIETLAAKPLSITSELSGRIAAPRIAEVRARVAGVVMQRVFKEGHDVKQGDVLFRIDPAPFKADLDSAQANLSKAEANAFQARLQEQRYSQLVEGNAISGQDYDNARAAVRQTNAEVAANKAAVERARLNLGYATVTAPISGRIGRALVTEGALVGQNEATPLALIQQLDPIHADLTQSTRELNDLRRAFRAGSLKQVGQDQAKATLIQDDGSLYPLPGKLLFAEISVDPGTGQIILRSEFPNPDLDLLPGSFVRVRLEQAVDKQGISVPQRAITRDSAGIPMVLLLDAEQTVSLQPVELGAVIEDRWIVSSGLKAGDRIVVEGLQHARPGEKVEVDDSPLVKE
ncbi:efflux RND transporter periplasmic adaptor subunit [Pseudomonas fluorescens]|uniref:efflux RND transporter periplasmic adaptor subunit n=1 Tax=Pseudomonas fluorescens TaxID=294 RepID=UPI0030039ED3